MLPGTINDPNQANRECISECVCRCFLPNVKEQRFYIYVGKDTLHHGPPVIFAAKNFMFLVTLALLVLLYSLAWEFGSFLFKKGLSGPLDSIFS